MIRVLVVDSENPVAGNIVGELAGQKTLTTVVCGVEDALAQLHAARPHAVILATSSDQDRDEKLCRAVCARTLAPVLVVGGEDRKDAVERLLSAGADAHVLQPLTPGVLVAQLWALLRRVGLASSRSQT